LSDTLTPATIGGLNIVRAGTGPQGAKLNILVHGEPGCGKTWFAASAAEVKAMGKVLLLDIEGGTLSIPKKYPSVDIVRITHWRQIQDVYNVLYDTECEGYGTVILDSATEAQKYSMDSVMSSAVARDDTLDRDMPMQRHWGVNIEHMRKMIRAFRDLPCHTIITALTKEDQDQKTFVTKRRPSMSGKLSSEIAGFMDIVFYMYVKEDEEEGTIRVLGAKAGETYTAKDRSDSLPNYIAPPAYDVNMKTVYDIVIGGKPATTQEPELSDIERKAGISIAELTKDS
jgi:hypothetical protein